MALTIHDVGHRALGPSFDDVLATFQGTLLSERRRVDRLLSKTVVVQYWDGNISNM